MATKKKTLTIAQLRHQRAEYARQMKIEQMGLYFTTRSAFGIPWWTWYWMIGARGRGKSYAAIETVIQFVRKYGQENVQCHYFRVSDTSVKAMLADGARKSIDAVLQRKYKLSIDIHGETVYNNNKPLIEFHALVSAAKKGKGVAEYDPEFLNNRPNGVKRFVFLIIDEFMTDQTQEKKTIGSPAKQFKIYFENIMRDQAQLDYRAVMVFGCANLVQECSEFMEELCGFLPPGVGRYKLKRKHMLIDVIPNSQAYIEKRKNSIGADIMGNDDPNYTNILKRDMETIIPKKTRLQTVSNVIKFSKETTDWFTLWDGNIIRKYSGQPYTKAQEVAMRRYLSAEYDTERVLSVIERQDARLFRFTDLMSQASFISHMREIKK